MECRSTLNKPLQPNSIPVTKAIPLDWVTLRLDQPYFDSASGNYFISVPLIKIPQNSLDEEEIRTASITIGSLTLLQILSKVNTEETRRQASANAFMADIFISLRPNLVCPEATDKVLVGIPKADLDAIPEDPNAPLPIASDEIITTTDRLVEDFRSLAEVIEEMAQTSGEEIKQQSGIDISKDADIIQKIPKVIETFLLKNGIIFNQDRQDLIVIGLDANNIPLYFLYDDGSASLNLRGSFGELRDIFIPRVSTYLKNLDFIIRQGNAGLGLSSLLAELPDLSFPNISVDFPFANFNLSVKGIRATYDTGLPKDEDGKDKEDEELEELSNNKDFSKKVQERLENVFDQRFAFLENIKTLDDVYSLLLNRTDITCFASFALECLSNNLPKDFIKCELIKSFLRNLSGKDFIRVLKELNLTIDILPEFAQSVREDLLICYEELDEKNKKELLDQINFRLKTNFIVAGQIREILSTEDVVNSFGFRGKLILEEKFVSQKDKVIDDLINLVGCEAFANLNNSSLVGATLANSTINALEQGNLCDLNFKLPKIPFIDFDLQLPTWDALKIIFDELALSILEGITTAFLELVKSLFEQLIRVCDEDGIPGIIDNLGNGDFLNSNIFKNALANSIGIDPSVLTDPEQFQQVLEGALTRLNVVPTITGDFGNIGAIAGSITRLMDDLGAILTPTELAKLLNGNSTDEVKQIVDCIITSKYPDLNVETDPGTDKKEKITNLFGTLGGLINKQKLFDDIILINDFGDDDFCDIQSDLAKRKLLSAKGLTPSQIDNEINKLKARKLARISQLANLIEDPNFAQKFVPGICSNSSFSFNPPQMNLFMEKALRGMFDGTKMTFDREINSFVPSLKETVYETKTVRKFIDVSFEKNDGNVVSSKIINPEWSRLVAQGFPDEIRDENGQVLEDETNDVERETQTSVPAGVGTIAGGLKNAFKNLSSDNILLNVDNGLVFTVPNSNDPYRQTTNNLQFLNPTISKIKEIAGSIANFGGNQNQQAELNAILDLVQPKQFSISYFVNNSCEVIDSSSLTISYKTQNSNEIEIFKTNSFFDVPEEVKSFIEASGLTNNISNRPPQETFLQKYFAKIINGVSGNQLTSQINDLMERELSNNKFFALFNNILVNFGKRITNSPLFIEKIIKNLNFTIADKNGCEVSLLDLSRAKNSLRDTIKNSCGEDLSPNQNPFQARVGALELAGLEATIKTLFRLYAIEFVVQNVFIFTQFNIKTIEEIDNSLVEFAMEEAKRDIKEFGNDYFDLVEKFSIQFAKNQDETINNFSQAFKLFYTKELIDVFEKINFIIGADNNSFNLSRTFIEKTIPFDDVSFADEDIDFGIAVKQQRFFTIKEVSQINTINQTKISNFDNTDSLIVDVENGFFILEKYAKVKYKETFPEGFRRSTIKNVCRIDELQNYLSNFSRGQLSNGISYSPGDIFEEIKMGLRISYVFNLNDNQFRNPGTSPKGALAELKTSLANQAKIININERAFFTKESFAVDTRIGFDLDRGGANVRERDIYLIPVCSNEIEVSPVAATTAGNEYFQVWEQSKENLIEGLSRKDEFKFMFNFITPLQKIPSLLGIFSYLYLSNLLEIDILFDGTKSSLKKLFQTFLNSGKLDYEDADSLEYGGSPGTYANMEAGNFDDLSPDIKAIIIGFILKTPIRILKGLVEISDPNIFIASKIALAARLACKPLPVAVPSLALLPSNVFPPPPLGPGIGPPISPLGFAYLAIDAFDSIPIPGCEEPEESDNYDKPSQDEVRRKFCDENGGS